MLSLVFRTLGCTAAFAWCLTHLTYPPSPKFLGVHLIRPMPSPSSAHPYITRSSTRVGSSTDAVQALGFGALSGNRQFLTVSLQRPDRPIEAKYLKFKSWSKIVNDHCLKIHTLIFTFFKIFFFFTNQERFGHTAARALGPDAIILIYVKFP